MSGELLVAEGGKPIAFGFDDLLNFHGFGSPGGVAHGFKAMERGLPLLAAGSPPERREMEVRTAFGGPGARDAFELVTRAVSDGRYTVDPTLERPERGRANERFVFELTYRGRVVTLAVRDGFVSEEFIDLARADRRNNAEERRLDEMKLQMAERITAAEVAEVYEVD